MKTAPFLLVAGARPNFMKVAPIAREMRRRGVCFRLLNTGQHHDPALSDVFLKELGLGRPDFNLGVGSGTHAQVTARILERGEPVLQKLRPRAVIVVGDVNSTVAMALAATKLHIPVAHVEAGLRSRDRTMPEEINRILTDLVSDLLLTPSAGASANLRAEGIPASRIARVGNVMMDSLVAALGRNRRHPPRAGGFLLMTFHRPSNVDSAAGLERLARFLREAARLLPVQLPLHPRTRAQLRRHGKAKVLASIPGLQLLEPLGYFDFVARMRAARAVVTDSGGVQEETSFLGVPCLTLRPTTERPLTVERGTNVLVGDGDDSRVLLRAVAKALGAPPRRPPRLRLWDGRASDRIVADLARAFI